jgi:hypothetical protein
MPSILTENASFDAPVTVPSDGDAATVASIIDSLQALTNRSKYLQQLCEASGVKIVRSVANITALRALTGMANQELCLVGNVGLYTFDNVGTDADFAPYVVVPTSGPGRWRNAVWQYVDAGGASGTSPRFDAIQVPNACVALAQTRIVSPTNVLVTASGFADEPSGMISNAVAVQTGDIVECECTGTIETSGPAVHVQLATFDGTTTTIDTGANVFFCSDTGSATPGQSPFSLRGHFVAGGAISALQWKLQVQASGGTQIRVWTPVRFVVRVTRP